MARLVKVPGVVQAAPVVNGQVLAMGPSQVTGAIIRGMEPEDLRRSPLVAGNIVKGSLRTFGAGEYGGDEIVVGSYKTLRTLKHEAKIKAEDKKERR